MALTPLVTRFLALLTITANVAVIGVVLLWLRSKVLRKRGSVGGEVGALVSNHGLVAAWCVAVVATLGSLYFSEVAHFVPCKLCWYQRIGMYPLVVILGVAALKRDWAVRRYVLPLLGMGGAISIYHYALQRFPDLSSASCDPAAPCTVTWVWEFHYISIPFMALSAFALIATLLLLGGPGRALSKQTDEQQERSIDEHSFGDKPEEVPASI